MNEPRVFEQSATLFVGLELSFIHIRSPDTNGHELIGPMWERFLPRSSEIKDRKGDPLYGVIYGRNEEERSHKHELQYIAAAMVNSANELPDEMVNYTVPAATFASFTHRGEITKISETIDHIYDAWLPDSGYKHAGIADIELYDGRFSMDASSEMEYWISIVSK